MPPAARAGGPPPSTVSPAWRLSSALLNSTTAWTSARRASTPSLTRPSVCAAMPSAKPAEARRRPIVCPARRAACSRPRSGPAATPASPPTTTSPASATSAARSAPPASAARLTNAKRVRRASARWASTPASQRVRTPPTSRRAPPRAASPATPPASSARLARSSPALNAQPAGICSRASVARVRPRSKGCRALSSSRCAACAARS